MARSNTRRLRTVVRGLVTAVGERLRDRRVALNSQSGQALVEIALVLPILTVGLISGAEFARAFSVQSAVQNAARAGAEGFAINQALTEPDVRCYAQQELVRTTGVTVPQGDPSHLKGYCPTTSSSSVIVPGVAAVTPDNMTDIVVGTDLTIDSSTSQETVTVTSVTATTFTASFTKSHGSSSYTIMGVAPSCTAGFCIQTWGVTSDYLAGSTPSKHVKVEVQYTYETIIAWPGVPHVFMFDRVMTMKLPL